MANEPIKIPAALARLVQTQSGDLAGEVRALLRGGQRRITIGLGPGVDVPLLDEELHAADVAIVDRELVVAAIRADPDGYVVERGESNFGLYVWNAAEPIWSTVPHMGSVRGLRPGDKVALGSTPAEAVQFELPESPLVPPPRARRRSSRQAKAAEQRQTRTPAPIPRRTAPPPPPRGSRPQTPLAARRRASPATPTGRPAERTAADRARFQDAFDVALRHWNYAMVSVGTDPNRVIVLEDPELADLRFAIGRNMDQPERGYDLFVKSPGKDLWVQQAGDGITLMKRGGVTRFRGAGNRIGFHGYVVELPAPAVPVPRFGPRQTPTAGEIGSVLGLSVLDLTSAKTVKARYRELARRFHPDRHDGEPGHLSRFLEIQACFDAWADR